MGKNKEVNNEVEKNEEIEVVLRKFRVKVGKATNKETGEEFPTFRTIQKNGKFMKMKFRQVVEEVPKDDCFIFVEEGLFSIDKNSQFPVLWIHAIHSTEVLYQPNRAVKASKADYEDYFE